MKIPSLRRFAPFLWLVLMLGLVGCNSNPAAQSVGPLVTISSPRNGERVLTGESVEFTTVASDSVTPIQRIELWVDGVLVGDSSTPTDEQLHQFTAIHDWVFEEAHTATVEAFAYNLENERSQVAEIVLRVDGPPPITATVVVESAESTSPTAAPLATADNAPTAPPATATPESITVLGRVTAQPGVNVRSGPARTARDSAGSSPTTRSWALAAPRWAIG